MLEVLHGNTPSITQQQRLEADEWLRNLGESPEIWNVAHLILSQEGLPVYTYFYGATYIVRRLRKGFKELSTSRERLEFRNCLIDHIVRLTRLDEASNQDGQPQGGKFRMVVRELGYALAVMSVHLMATREWPRAISDLSEILAENECQVALVAVLTSIPDVAKSTRVEISGKDRDAVIAQLRSTAPEVLDLLLGLLQSTEDAYLQGIVLKCFAAWAECGCLNTILVVSHPIFSACLQAARVPSLFKYASDALRGVIDYFDRSQSERSLTEKVAAELANVPNHTSEDVARIREQIIYQEQEASEVLIRSTLSLVEQFSEILSAASQEQDESVLSSLLTRLSNTVARLGIRFRDVILSGDPLGLDILSGAVYCLRAGGRKAIDYISPMWFRLAKDAQDQRKKIRRAFDDRRLDQFEELNRDMSFAQERLASQVQRAISALAHAIRLSPEQDELGSSAEEEAEVVEKATRNMCLDLIDIVGPDRLDSIIWVQFVQSWNYLWKCIKAEELGEDQVEQLEVPVRITLLEMIEIGIDPTWADVATPTYPIEVQLAIDVLLRPGLARKKTQMTRDEARGVLAQTLAYDPEFVPCPEAPWVPLSAIFHIANYVFAGRSYCPRLDSMLPLALELAANSNPGSQSGRAGTLAALLASSQAASTSKLARVAAEGVRPYVDKLILGCATRIGSRLADTDPYGEEVELTLREMHTKGAAEAEIEAERQRFVQIHQELTQVLSNAVQHLFTSIAFPSDPHKAQTAAKALRSLSQYCGPYLIPHFASLVALREFTHKEAEPYVTARGSVASAYRRVARDCLWALVRVIVTLPEEEARKQLDALFTDLTSLLQQFVSTDEGSAQAHIASVRVALSTLVDFLQALVDTRDRSSSEEYDEDDVPDDAFWGATAARRSAIKTEDITQLMISLTPLLQHVAKLCLGDADAIEDVCRCWTDVLRRLGSDSIHIADPIISACLELYQSQGGQHPGFLYVIARLAKALSSSRPPELTRYLIQVLEQISDFSFEHLTNLETVDQMPHLASDYIWLHQKFLTLYTQDYLQSRVAEPHLSSLYGLLYTRQESPLRAVCVYYQEVLSLLQNAIQAERARAKLPATATQEQVNKASVGYLEPEFVDFLDKWIVQLLPDLVNHAFLSIMTSERAPTQHYRLYDLLGDLCDYDRRAVQAAIIETFKNPLFDALTLEQKNLILASSSPAEALVRMQYPYDADQGED